MEKALKETADASGVLFLLILVLSEARSSRPSVGLKKLPMYMVAGKA